MASYTKLAGHKFSTCGVLPSVMYGAEVVPPPVDEISRLRTWALQAKRLSTVGINRDRAFLLLPTKDDPAYLAASKILHRYHSEWYHSMITKQVPPGVLDHKILARAYRTAAARRDVKAKSGKPRRWDDPISGSMRAAAQVGWVFSFLLFVFIVF